MKINEMYLRSGKVFSNVEVFNIDKHCFFIEGDNSSSVFMVFKHAVDGCDGIPHDKLNENGDPTKNQIAYLNKWSRSKEVVKISISGKIIESSIWNSKDPFVLFLTPTRFISKTRIDYIEGDK